MTFVVPKSWFSNCDFTTDWSSRAFGSWVEHLGHLRKEPIDILEIGAWEGRGSLFFLNFFAKSTLTALDIFTLGNEGRFDRNVVEKFASRTTKVKGRSTIELDRFAVEGKTFDLIYLDGSHLRDDVMIDSILAWRLLKVGGYLIWDDYELIKAMPGHFDRPDQDPKPAVDVFTAWHGKEMDMLHREYQVIVRKTASHYHEEVPGQADLIDTGSGAAEARRRARELEHRLAEAEEILASERAKLTDVEDALRRSQDEIKQALIAVGEARNEAATRGKHVQQKERELAALRRQLRSSDASAKQRIADLEADLIMSKQAAAVAEASLARRFQELAVLTALLQEQEAKGAALMDHIEWLNGFNAKVAHQPRWWGLLPETWRLRQQREQLRRSGIFDASEYLDRNPDVRDAGMDPVDHYLRHGFLEGRGR